MWAHWNFQKILVCLLRVWIMMQRSFISHGHHPELLRWKKTFYHDIHLLGWIMHIKAHTLQNANEIKNTDGMKMTSILLYVLAASLRLSPFLTTSSIMFTKMYSKMKCKLNLWSNYNKYCKNGCLIDASRQSSKLQCTSKIN